MTKKKKTSVPKFGSGVVSDSVDKAGLGKTECQGIFTIFWAWGYPCIRSWFVTFSVFEVPKGMTSVTVSLRKRGSKKSSSLGVANIDSSESNAAPIVVAPLQYHFNGPGRYEIICQFRDHPGRLTIPVEVRSKDWPRFTKKELAFARKNPQAIGTVQATVHCSKCQSVHAFEETVVPDIKPKGNVQRFPDSGTLECSECGHQMNLLDIQGRLRATLKENIRLAMREMQ